jgi:lipopolysaccharide assembly protein A
MRILVWLVRVAAFFALFGFALNNQHPVTLHAFFGLQWQGPMILVVLGALSLGCACGALAMLPSWWRHKRRARPDAAASSMLGPQEPEPTPAHSVPMHPPRDGL